MLLCYIFENVTRYSYKLRKKVTCYCNGITCNKLLPNTACNARELSVICQRGLKSRRIRTATFTSAVCRTTSPSKSSKNSWPKSASLRSTQSIGSQKSSCILTQTDRSKATADVAISRYVLEKIRWRCGSIDWEFDFLWILKICEIHKFLQILKCQWILKIKFVQ